MPVIIKKPVPKNEIRWENFRLLAYEYGTKAKLASNLGVTLADITIYFSKKPEPITDIVAQTIEQVLAKPAGWMDRKNYDPALSSDEWLLLDTFRAGSDRDRIILSALANVLGAMPKK